MKMKNTFTYFFLLLILLLSGNPGQSQAQQKRITGPRLGIDVSGLVWQYVQPGRLSVAASVDYEIMPAIYAAGEMGRLQINRDQDIFHYQSTGYFGKIGADYNFLQHQFSETTRYDMIYGGLRFGAARYSHRADDITIQDDYWGSSPGSNIPEHTMWAYWSELVAGLRVEALKNLFLGWSIRAQLMISRDRDPRMSTWMIPGYGEAQQSTSLSFTYSISYRIPLVRVSAGQAQ